MSETWLTSKIVVDRWEDKPEVVRRLIAPIVSEFENESWFKTFHFLSYGSQEGFHLLFRVNLDSAKKDALKASIERKKTEVNQMNPLIKSIDYEAEFVENTDVLKQEQERFGKLGLEIFLKYFEYVSRTIIRLLGRPQDEISAYPIKYRMTLELFHFLLNPLLYPSFDGDGEVSAHIQAIRERYITLVWLKMNEGMPKELALKTVAGSTSLVDKDWGLKFTVSVEKA